MSYIKINDEDISMYCNKLIITTQHKYTSQTNAAGDTVVDYINKKRVIEVGIIATDKEVVSKILNLIDGFSVNISFRNPQTNALEENVPCIIPASNVAYYTIQSEKVLYDAFMLEFIEL